MSRRAKSVAVVAGIVLAASLFLTLLETRRWWRMWRTQDEATLVEIKGVEGNGEARCESQVTNQAAAHAGTELRLCDAVGKVEASTANSGGEHVYTKAVIWLSGVSDYGNSAILPEQLAFVQKLAAQSAGSVVIAGHLPADEQTDARYKRSDLWRKLGFKTPPLWTWAAHNWWQFVCASVGEQAYGRDIATAIIMRLQQTGLHRDSPLLFACASAGAQVVLASAPFLRAQGYGPIYVVALGGEFGSPRGFEAVAHITQLVGDGDGWGKIGAFAFPGRWLPGSRCNEARRDGRLFLLGSGPHSHYGARSYLDDVNIMGEGTTYADRTLDVVLHLPWWNEWTAL